MALLRNTLVGRPIRRTEDLRLTTGSGVFVGDVVRPGMLHAAVLRSPAAHGRIVAVDTAATLHRPGVRLVVTAESLGRPVPRIPLRIAPIGGSERFLQPVIATGKLRYVGEPVAIVVAEDQAAAEDALEAIGLDVEELGAIPGREAAEAGRVLLFEENGSNVAAHYRTGLGDAERAFAEADYVRGERFRVQRHTAVPMETRGLLAEWNAADGRLTVWGAAKVPFFNRRHLARMLELSEDAIDLIEVDVGGGFGVRGEFYPEDFLIPFAARALARPVRWIESRHEHLAATHHSREVECELRIACRRDGTITGLSGRVFGDMGAYVSTTGGIVPSRTGQFLPGPYRIPNVALEVTALVTNKTPVGSYRGPGRFESTFFRERLLDMAAHDLGLDPVELRRKNLIREAELPYAIGTLVPYEPTAVYDSGDYHAAFARCLDEIGWADKAPLQGRVIDGRHHGLGLACFVESSGAGPKENARLVVEPDGSVSVSVGSSALGQGIETSFAQIAADALGLPFAQVRIRHGSTTLLDEGFGSYHSRAVVMGGSAILDGAEKLLAALREAGARGLGCAAAEVRLADGRVFGPDGRSLGFGELSPQEAPISAAGSFSSSVKTFTYGTHAAHVAVDAETGEVALLDYVAVEDAGRVINPMIVHGQKLGAIVQGLGGTFLEHLVYDEHGQLLTGSLADYALPIAGDFPRIRAITLELRPSPGNPLGAKGAGEDAIAAVAAAVGNAVAAALASFGVEPTELPLSPPRLWALIEAARARAGL